MKRIALLTIAILALVVPFLACGSTAGSTGTAVTPTAPTDNSSSGSTPTPAAKTWKVGDIVAIGHWQVTVHSVKTNTGDDFNTPKSGNIYLLVDVTVKNTSSSADGISSLASFSLKDSTGQTYTETIMTSAPNAPDGNVAAGALLRGTLAYEVPKAMKSFTFDFSPSFGSGDIATWNLTVK